jgi:hypothetical protein
MYRGILAAAVLATVAPIQAQQAPTVPKDAPAPAAGATLHTSPCPPDIPVIARCEISCEPNDPRIWGSAEYLFYFLKPSPVPVPLATTGPAAGRGILGNTAGPGQVVLGNADTDFGMFNGLQLTLGGWLNRDQNVGIEGSAFLLEDRAERNALTGGPGGLPVLARPYLDTTIGNQNARILALPGAFSGGLATAMTARLWGAEADAVLRLVNGRRVSLDGLTGFRFLSLEEGLTITDVSDVLPGGITSFNGAGVLPPARTSVTDHFSTQNRFYGVPLGLRLTYTGEKLFVAATGKVSLGNLHRVVNIDGTTTLTTDAVPLPSTVPGGLYALSSNSGRYTSDVFAAVPEAALRVGYRVSRCVTITAGYNFLYIPGVVRPGEQIDPVLNPTRIPTSPTLAVPFGPPRRPQFLGRDTDFWAHGASVGLTLTY